MTDRELDAAVSPSRRIHRRKATPVEVESKATRERNFVQELREFYRDMKARGAEGSKALGVMAE